MQAKNGIIFSMAFILLIVGCYNNGALKKNKVTVDSSNVGKDTVSHTTSHSYVNDSLNNFLAAISVSIAVQKIPIVFTRMESQGDAIKFQYSNGTTSIILVEIKNTEAHGFIAYEKMCMLKRLYINGQAVTKFIDAGGIVDSQDGMVLNDIDDDSLNACIYVTPTGKFLLFEGSNQTAESSNFRKIEAEYLIPLNNPSHTGFFFTNLMYVPSGCYLGYRKKENSIIFLDMESYFPKGDGGEYTYDVFAKSIDLHNNTVKQLKDSSGNIYHIKLAVPNCWDDSDYRVVEYHWWP